MLEQEEILNSSVKHHIYQQSIEKEQIIVLVKKYKILFIY